MDIIKSKNTKFLGCNYGVCFDVGLDLLTVSTKIEFFY